jgi:hypothetical protein
MDLRNTAAKWVKAQLRASSDRSSKILKDRKRIEATIEVEGVGRLVLTVDGRGGYSLRGYPEDDEASGRNLLAVGVLRAEGIETIELPRTSDSEGQ